jgi:D-lactate dehydrogenase
MISLQDILPEERILARLIDRISFAADAGFYHLIPQAVVRPVNEQEVLGLFQYSRERQIPIVFRTGGTSLSGQSVTDGILVDLSQNWNRIQIEANGARVRVQPGITGGLVNQYLTKYGRKIGPDPSSIVAAMMGGILSNNASGMCCGTRDNSYHTMQHIRFMLPDGKIFNTEQSADYGRFASEEPALYQGLSAIRNQILGNPALQEKIRYKYQIKNTIGYSLNAFLDYEDPLDIFAHLLIGAEGTLAFIAEAVLHTVPDWPCKATAMLYFPDIEAACAAIIPLTDAGAVMVELMDSASLRAVADIEGIDPFIKTLPDGASALLVEFQAADTTSLHTQVDAFLQNCTRMPLLRFPTFTEAAAERNFLWKIRKGLFPSVGAVRKKGTTVILEDVAFPVQHLGAAIHDLQGLFTEFNYDNAIIFGHAKDGNIHFVVTQAFETTEEINRYDSFIKAVVDLVVKKYNGSLKAEHGTGRNMAPFVETEWGGDAYAIMQQVKALADPGGLLNPGVIINADARAHITHLKAMPAVEEEVDKCIECGYCEPACPSRDFTSSPRRRIVIRRALVGLQAEGNRTEYKELLHQYQFDGLDTCAVDGMCATACPVDINTGDLVKRLRRESHAPLANALALQTAKRFGLTTTLVRGLLRIGNFINVVTGKNSMTRLTGFFKKIHPSFPLWSTRLQAPPDTSILKQVSTLSPQSVAGTIVYFPTCISRMMGKYAGQQDNIMAAFLSICNKTNIAVKIPDQIQSACCSQLYASKGYSDAYRFKANESIERLWVATEQGKWPVVLDVSSCTHTLKQVAPVLTPENLQRFKELVVWDAIEFIRHRVISVATIRRKKKNIVLHPVCALEKMHIADLLKQVAAHFAEEVVIPVSAKCCGMAGDRGFIVPGLTKSATMAEAAEVCGQPYEGYYSTTTTCELALSQATGQSYESILYLVDEAI